MTDCTNGLEHSWHEVTKNKPATEARICLRCGAVDWFVFHGQTVQELVIIARELEEPFER